MINHPGFNLIASPNKLGGGMTAQSRAAQSAFSHCQEYR